MTALRAVQRLAGLASILMLGIALASVPANASSTSPQQASSGAQCVSSVHAYKPYRDNSSRVRFNYQYHNCGDITKVCASIWAYVVTPPFRGGWYMQYKECSPATTGTVVSTALLEWNAPGMFFGRITAVNAAGNVVDSQDSAIYAD